MKRSAIKKKSKTPLAKAKEALWKTLKQVIDIRDGPICISCGAIELHGHNKHGGHFIPSASCGGFLRYDLRNVHNQCAYCNLYCNGAGVQYTLAIQKKYGQKFVEQLIKDKQVTVKLDLDYVNEMTYYYESLLTKSQKQLLDLTKKYAGFKSTQ